MIVTSWAGVCSCAVFLLLSTPIRAAATTDTTYLTISGDILETPCTIDPGSRDQTINMGTIPLSMISGQSSGKTIPFSIRLKNCLLQRGDPRKPDWQRFSVTFNGLADGNDFALTGVGRGVALRIADDKGEPARPGVALPQAMLNAGENTLHYTLQLVSNHRAGHEGAFSSVINFQLNYF